MNELVKVENGEIVVAQELANRIIAFEKESLKMKLIADDLKEKIKSAMEENGIDKEFSIETEEGSLKVVYKKSYFKNSVDTEKLKKDNLYDKYKKQSVVSSSISISVE